MHTYVPTLKKAREQPWVYSADDVHTLFEVGLLLAWNSRSRPGWMASKSQGSYFYLPSTWNRHRYAHLHSFVRLSEICLLGGAGI